MKKLVFTWALGLLPLALNLRPGSAAEEPTNSTALTVSGEVGQPLSLTLSELRKMPRTKLTLQENDAKEIVFEGVAVSDVLERAKPKFSNQCCSNAPNAVVIVHAADGYRALFSMTELVPVPPGQKVLLADTREGEAINGSQGPPRIVAPNDKSHARWVRQVNAIEILFVGSSTNSPGR